MSYNFECPQCSTELIVKRWTTLFSTGEKVPWCFCPRCKYKCHAEKVKMILLTKKELGVYYWLKEKSLEDVAKYIVNLEECLDYEIQS